jgi:hypothetical protein
MLHQCLPKHSSCSAKLRIAMSGAVNPEDSSVYGGATRSCLSGAAPRKFVAVHEASSAKPEATNDDL